MSLTEEIDLSHVPKLDGSNYSEWKLRVTATLDSHELWEVVSGAEPEPELVSDNSNHDKVKAWRLKDYQAKAIIIMLLDNRPLRQIASCKTAKKLWEKLWEKLHLYNSSTPTEEYTLRKFLNYKIHNGDSLVNAFREVEELAQALQDFGNPMTELTVVWKIVSALAENYQAFRTAWGFLPEASQTMETLLARLRIEELSETATSAYTN